MPTRQLKVTVRHGAGAEIVDLKGEINSFAETSLKAAYAQATETGASIVLLNFRDVDYINSTGIALIVGLMAQARQSGRRLIACGLSEHYVEIFKITRLADFMSIFPDEASALSAVSAPAT